MGDCLKEMPNAQIFTVFGTLRTELRPSADEMFEIEMQGCRYLQPGGQLGLGDECGQGGGVPRRFAVSVIGATNSTLCSKRTYIFADTASRITVPCPHC
jgi:hypothetical protein